MFTNYYPVANFSYYFDRYLKMSKGSPADEQLLNYKKTVDTVPTLTMSNGCPIGNKTSVLTVGPRGPIMLQDVAFLDELGHFDREKIPDRVVHANGTGAHGYFEVTHDIMKYCKADIFSSVGKQTPCFVRFSTVALESGSPDTVVDPRGFSIKFYTEEGNWDLVCNNTPVFFHRDPFQFPNFIHALQRNPQTHLRDFNAFWDFCTLRPESIHQLMYMFGDRGIPDGYRHMNGYGGHAFKMVNKDNNPTYCKFHFKTKQEIKNIPFDVARRLCGEDPDYAKRDLFVAIDQGNYPEWELFIQLMTFEQAETSQFNPFDITKVWPHADYPLIPVGKLILNRNVKNYFAEVEQVGFSPSHVVPGIEFSPDRMLQGRIFSYPDTQFHRLGPNHMQLPINCPYRARPRHYQRNGLMCYDSQLDAPTYHPNSFGGPKESPIGLESAFHVIGDVQHYETGEEDNYVQPMLFWTKVLDEAQRERLCNNLVFTLAAVNSCIKERVVELCKKVYPDFGNMVEQKIKAQETVSSD